MITEGCLNPSWQAMIDRGCSKTDLVAARPVIDRLRIAQWLFRITLLIRFGTCGDKHLCFPVLVLSIKYS